MQERLQQSDTTFNFDHELSVKVANEMLPSTSVNNSLTVISKDTNSIISEINNTSLLNEDDANKLKNSKEFIVSTYKDVPIYNSRIAKVSSILSDGKFPTADAKFWQCKMQAEVHFNELVRASFKLDRAHIDIEELDYQIKVLDSMITEEANTDLNKIKLQFDRRRLLNKLNQYNFELKLLEKDIKQRLREISEWSDIAKEYEQHCEHDTSHYESHTYQNHILALTNLYNNAKTIEEKEKYKDQANTFLRLIKQPLLK